MTVKHYRYKGFFKFQKFGSKELAEFEASEFMKRIYYLTDGVSEFKLSSEFENVLEFSYSEICIEVDVLLNLLSDKLVDLGALYRVVGYSHSCLSDTTKNSKGTSKVIFLGKEADYSPEFGRLLDISERLLGLKEK